jgi:hypothetical protein
MDDVQRFMACWEDVDMYVLAAVKLVAGRGWFCCRAKMHAALFILSREFKELAHLRSPFGIESIDVNASIRKLVEHCLLEERLEVPGVIEGVALPGYGIYKYRLTKAGRALASRAVGKMSPEVRRRMKELLKMDIWSLIGYAYVKYPMDARHIMPA